MIAARDLAFGYGDEPVLSAVSIELGPDETLAVLGANGAGKTTLLRLLAGLETPDAGSIERDGVVGFAPQDPRSGLFAETVAEEVAFFPRNRGIDVERHSAEAMRSMDVLDLRERGPYTLSHGQQRRVAIASVLAGDPDAVVLDEPTAGLDRRGERRLGDLLGDLDAAVAFSTHATGFAYEVADRVAVLIDGEVARIGDPRTVLADEAFLSEAGVHVPGIVEWARRRGIDPVPEDFEAAVAAARGRR